MKILHLLSAGGIGGIEVLCRDISEFSRDDNEFCCLFKGGEIAKQMKQMGTTVYYLFNESKIKRLLHLVQLVKRNNYDVIIVHHEGFGIYLAYLLCSFFCPKIKYIKYLHCSFEPEFFYVGNSIKDRLNYWALKQAVKRSDKLIAVSEFVKGTYVEEFGLPVDAVKVIYNGIKEDEEISDYQKIINGQPVVILYSGRLVHVKGVHVLIRAVKLLVDQGFNIVLEVLGDGPCRVKYEKLAEDLEIRENVHFRGYRLDKDSFLSHAHIFCYPSIWQEAFGISIIEAMQKGLICVASDVGGIPEIITNGVDGYLVDANDEQKLANTLEGAIINYRNDSVSKMQNAAMRKAKQFSIQKMIDSLSEEYR